jgi:hypothetical protein
VTAGAAAIAATIWMPDLLPAKVHSWVLGAGVVITAISESHFKSLISELQGLLRRGSYSAWQLDALNQVIPGRIKAIWRLWIGSILMKILVGVAVAALQWDKLAGPWPMVCILGGYYLLIASILLALHAARSLRKTEELVNRVIQKENETKERNRLLKELQSGPKHDFEGDKMMQAYSKPSQNL